MFILHERLKADTIGIGRLELSLLLLMNDSSLPWLILVPEREGAKEIDDLTKADRSTLIEEIACVSSAIRRSFNPAKINVGALGNLVPQFHVHVIGRFMNDRAWPGPIWGMGPMRPYIAGESNGIVSRLREILKGKIR